MPLSAEVEALLTIVQAQTDEHRGQVERLFREYLEWGNVMLEREFGITFPIDDMLEQDMRTLGKFGPPDGRLLLAMNDTSAVGCACLRRLGAEVGEIKRMYVRPEARRRGVGRALLETTIEAARSIGYSSIRLDSASFMAEAHALYRSVGFEDIAPYTESEIPSEYHHHWVFMERRLG